MSVEAARGAVFAVVVVDSGCVELEAVFNKLPPAGRGCSWKIGPAVIGRGILLFVDAD